MASTTVKEHRKYPEWASESLREWHTILLDGWPSGSSLDKSIYLDVLETLLTDPAMESVWNALQEASHSGGDRGFLEAVYRARLGPEANWERLTQSDRNKKIDSILQAADRLGKLAFGSPMAHLPDSAFERWNIERPEFGNIHWPDLRIVINGLHSQAMQLRQTQPLVKKPGSEDAHRLYFFRYLSQYLAETCENLMYSEIATVARLVLRDSSIEREVVRKALDSRRA